MAIPAPTLAPQIVKGAIRRGTGRWIFVPTFANPAAPTSAEISAGTDYTAQIASVDGFKPTTDTVDFGNAATRVIGNVPGETKLSTGTVMFNCSNNPAVTDARGTFKDGSDGVSIPTSGYWVDMPNGNVTSALMRVYQATCTAANLSPGLSDVLTLETVFALGYVSGFLTIPTS